MTMQDYIDEIPADQRAAFGRLRTTITGNLPPGFEEALSHGMPGYVAPHSRYPAGYHCDPAERLPI
ncbi:MAG: hypothetical protein A2087_02460 [Spirochaetes bacterium GWD1_61_31]|nr:MAG: hypothetical protein A2Y37_13955 [Spirochaetes bacterium GWB1_60_80]OHD31079.1 MAG: hypothetical protein A2004_07765 [Spirochaetes bacterium GWC1_61_12]OHD38150.1 MAG: hypothetical protein A2087_02460 [Spirochaetes bacterium GWD1_61_31]OHD45294.1 MAG: hypothetical protein A2Y35_02535 [Spirochaetes bacterium GWE1_60_18]OHD59600.1 MAG: hypothetical protein A2Y32_12780 [Spirochaetes bacterium GWF1_60_12]HAP43988.1 hypothetical protein [Spirochaetaceae bacterium]